MLIALIGVLGILLGSALNGWYNRRTSREVAKTATLEARNTAAIAARESRTAAAIAWNREHAHAVMLRFLEKAKRTERFLYQAHMERENPADEGHDLSDPTDGWLDEVWDAAEAIGLYGSEEAAAAALNFGLTLQSFGAALPDVPVDLRAALAAALEACRMAVRLDLGIDQPQ